ncbi:hypothetical protein [Bacillus methanolicus]|uniref:Uncharacterized protein n=1 Tax=Bacillus methanolicus (strain MGA3 / ATCC 53907) TaxID=796606 RepID=I3E9G6_BACMM|nr:hypothetical protein [Bacillus methanolicus]AIE60385.1 hypothetical protein BMMGA3_09935 [Bacillus methanolicus MGA3]EIJ83137.1 hypothetical protein MGA3_07935 [Bacillus methanolicus MGA3]UQD52404.1 hypothetical protein C0971_10580 [Bacillus methanolicus]
MDIQQYYKKYAEISLNASIAACIPPFFILIIWLVVDHKLPILVMTLPFMVYSFFCYQNYLVGKRRYEEAAENSLESNRSESFIESNDMLIAFLPAPSLRMLLFAPSGKLIGEVKDLRFWKWRWFLPYFMDRLFPGMYGLYNDKGELTAQIHLGNGKDGFIKIYENDELLGFYIRIENDQLSDLKGEFVLGDEEKMFCAIRSELNGEMRFYDQTGKTVCGLKKGWMPLEWGKYFRDPNTPILSFHHQSRKEEKIAVISFLVQCYCYRNH